MSGRGGARPNSGPKPGWEDRQAAKLMALKGRALKACTDLKIDPFKIIGRIAKHADDESLQFRAAEFLCNRIEPPPARAEPSRGNRAPPAIVTLNFTGEVPPVTIDQPMNGDADQAPPLAN